MKRLASVALLLSMLPADAEILAPFDAWPAHARAWTDTVLDRFGEEWDDEAGMIGSVTGHGVRGTAFYAAGLALRGRTEDAERVERAVKGVIAQQYDTPGTAWHGTYKRSDAEPDPPEKQWREWTHYDPNWREFVGLTLILLLDAAGDDLDPAVVTRIRDSLRLACEGAYERGVDWNYTNIALMSAYLLAWGGRQLDEPAWRERGDALAREIHAEFMKHETFHEYNSPTYYGVDLLALGMWRCLPLTPEMQLMGEEMDAGLWRDIGRYYHAGLGNLCGPYDRSYGMDMREYVAITGIAIGLASGEPGAMPGLGGVHGKSGETAYLPMLAALGMSPPEDVLPHLRAFQGPRAFSRIIVGPDRRVAHAWLHETWMAGIETNTRVGRKSGQYHPVTAHWRDGDGRLCWLRLVGDAAIVVERQDGDLPAAEVTLKFADRGEALEFEVQAPAANAGVFSAESWQLQGITVRLEASDFDQQISERPAGFTIRLTPARDAREARLRIAFEPGTPLLP